MEGPLFRVPCSSFPKDYRGHIDSEIMGYLFTNNNNSDQGPVQTKLWPTRRRSMWWWSVEMGSGTEWSDRKSKSRGKDTADDTFLDPCPR